MATPRGLKRIRFIHISDLHLGRKWYIKYGIDERLRRAIEKLIDLVKKEKIDFLLIGGDLYENRAVNRDDIGFLLESMKSIKIPVFIAPGNHDYYGESYYMPSKMELSGLGRWPDNVYIFSKNEISSFEFNDFVIYGRANYSMDERPFDTEISADHEKINIYLFHGSRKVSAPPEKEMWLPFHDRELMDSPFDFIALGHYHNYQEISDGERIRGLYPGSFIPTQMDETGERYGVVVEIEKSDGIFNINLHKERFSDFVIREIEIISVNDEMDSIIRRILERVDEFEDKKDTIFRIELNGQGMLIKDELEEMLNMHLTSRCMGYEIDMNNYIYLDPFEAISENTVEGRFIMAMKQKIKNEDDPEKRRIYENALRYGLDAFRGRELRPRYE